MPSIKILTIDGGGIRGIIPAVILGELETRLGSSLWRHFDLIAGTSTGGIIALGLGTPSYRGQPYSPQQLLNLYVTEGPAIFKKIPVYTWIHQLVGPKYPPNALEATLKQFFDDAQFSSALTPLLISSYDLQTQLPFFFKSHMIASSPNYDWPVTSIARATSAAPTFFPPLKLDKGGEHYALVDGGVFVNNPAVAAYAEARWMYRDLGDVDFVMVSVGTGDRHDSITYARAHKWGLLGWAQQIVPVLMDSVSEAVDYELNSMPGCKYYRLQVPDLAGSCAPMDNVTPENVQELQDVAKKFLQEHKTRQQLDEICKALGEGRGSNMPGVGVKALMPRYQAKEAVLV